LDSTPEYHRNCAYGAVASGQKKAPAECIAPGWRGSFSGGWLCRDWMYFGASRTDDLVGGSEDVLGALFGYRFRVKTTPTADPILNIPATISGSLKPQRFTTKKRHGFRFDLAQTTRCGLIIGEICLSGMAQNYVCLCSPEHKPTYVAFVVMWSSAGKWFGMKRRLVLGIT